ncbi:MAG: T9SS type A sorting domain-containing protein [Candidatus Absconditabacteria bacterium]
MTTKTLENNQEQPQSNISKVKDFATKHGKTLVAALAITGAMATAEEATAQPSATKDPQYFSISNPYKVPNMQDKATLNLSILTGQGLATTINGMDNGGTIDLRDPLGNNVKANVVNNTIMIDKPGLRTRDYTVGGVLKTTSIYVNYQAAVGSPTLNEHHDVNWKKPTEATKRVTAGPNMSYYRRRNMDESIITKGATDSVKNLSAGRYIAQTTDAKGLLTRDTIDIVNEPTILGNTITLETPTGITFKILKVQSGSVSTFQTLVGDGTSHDIVVPNGIYAISTQVPGDTHTEERTLPDMNLIGTELLEVGTPENSFRANNRELFRDKPVASIIYSINGKVMKELGTGISDHITMPENMPAGTYIIQFTENKKIIAKKFIIK